MTCRSCAERRKRMRERLAKKKAKGQVVQAAAIGAVLAVTEVAGKVIGIHGEVEDERQHEAARSESGSGAREGRENQGSSG